MAKEWVLNIATNRWGLNKKRSVGPVSQWIREVSPRTIDEWQEAYLKRLRDFLKIEKQLDIAPDDYLTDLGKRLYIKISEVLQSEIESIQEADCIEYIFNLVIQRTFEGYRNEIKTIYGQLEKLIGHPVQPAPDEWDRLFNVDFFISVGNYYIGIQIKPITYDHLPEVHKWKEWTRKSHQKFRKKYGGDVFIVFSAKQNGKKVIVNPDVVDAIRNEISRLQSL